MERLDKDWRTEDRKKPEKTENGEIRERKKTDNEEDITHKSAHQQVHHNIPTEFPGSPRITTDQPGILWTLIVSDGTP